MLKTKAPNTCEFIHAVLKTGSTWHALPPTKCVYRFEDLRRFGIKNRLIFLHTYYRNWSWFDIDFDESEPFRDVMLPTDPWRTWLSVEQIEQLLFAGVMNSELTEASTNFLRGYRKLLKELKTHINRYSRLKKRLDKLEV